MDIAGGVTLTYKLDFSEYEKTYKDETELNSFKKSATNIIRTKIDNRINELGVSDTRAFTKRFGGEDFLVVQIGGDQDLEKAKETIGKTIQLQFKVPAEATNEVRNERKASV